MGSHPRLESLQRGGQQPGQWHGGHEILPSSASGCLAEGFSYELEDQRPLGSLRSQTTVWVQSSQQHLTKTIRA